MQKISASTPKVLQRNLTPNTAIFHNLQSAYVDNFGFHMAPVQNDHFETCF